MSSLIITWPAPLGTKRISPSVLFEYIVFPSSVRLSTVQLSTLGKVADAYAGPKPEELPPDVQYNQLLKWG